MALNDQEQADIHTWLQEIKLRSEDIDNKVGDFYADERDLSRNGNAFHDINIKVNTIEAQLAQLKAAVDAIAAHFTSA